MVGVPPEVAGVSVRPDERNLTVDACSHTQEVVVGEVTDDDVGLLDKAFDGSEVHAESGWRSIFDEPGHGP